MRWLSTLLRRRADLSDTESVTESDGAPEHLTLPSAAGGFWMKIRDKTAAMLNSPTDTRQGRNSYEIGGGSILAARWGHRQSYDIGLTTPDPNGTVAETIATGWGLADAVNGIIQPQSTMYRVVISTREGTLDVTKMRPRLNGQQRPAIVNGKRETVLTTAQILAGKLARAKEIVARDVYDIVTASRIDPNSLERACSDFAPPELEAIATIWDAQTERIQKEAAQKIMALDGTPATDHHNLGERGAAAIRAAIQPIERDHSQRTGTRATPTRPSAKAAGSRKNQEPPRGLGR